jgi:hypothetical protein
MPTPVRLFNSLSARSAELLERPVAAVNELHGRQNRGGAGRPTPL